nr:hypothetical protein [Micromonospora sp. ATA51]
MLAQLGLVWARTHAPQVARAGEQVELGADTRREIPRQQRRDVTDLGRHRLEHPRPARGVEHGHIDDH